MANDNERIPWRLELLLHLNDPTYKSNRPDARDLADDEEVRKFRLLIDIRDGYKWEWNAGARYLYTELIRAYGLDGESRKLLLELAKPKPGRKPAAEKALRIAELRQQGMTAKQIAKTLEHEGDPISIEAVESYSKRRREPSIKEQTRAAVNRAFQRRGKSPGDSSR